jgi:hypothetical protein
MAKAPKKKRARDLTTDEALTRVFGAHAAKRLRKMVEEHDTQTPKKPKRKVDRN